MKLSSKKQVEYSIEELSILEKVIDYADQQKRDARNVSEGVGDDFARQAILAMRRDVSIYDQLRKNGYVKTVIIDTELAGRVVIRLTPVEASTTGTGAEISGPHSRLGRLAVIAGFGYKGESEKWGEYRVNEVRLFDRFDGVDFEVNVKNFLRMQVDGDQGSAEIKNLRQFVKGGAVDNLLYIKCDEVEKSKNPDGVVDQIGIQNDLREKSNLRFASDLLVSKERSDAGDDLFLEIDYDLDDDFRIGSGDSASDGYFGLNERFFSNQTIDQSRIISRSPMGPMFVEGVAGSGKTSAALGRMKMLTTFDMRAVTDEKSFYQILGAEHDYWAKEYAGEFSQISCVGFVRTGELISYLRETCKRLDMHDLPVFEFGDLRAKLIKHYQLTSGGGRTWMGSTDDEVVSPDITTMNWLHATDQAMSRYLSQHLMKQLPKLDELVCVFDEKFRGQVKRVGIPALALLTNRLKEICEELSLPAKLGEFSLDGLASRIGVMWDELRKRVMDPNLLWVEVGTQSFFAADARALAEQMIFKKAALYRRSGQRMVFADARGIVDKTLRFCRAPKGPEVSLDVNSIALLKAGQLFVRDARGEDFPCVVVGLNQLYLALSPESTEKIFQRIDNQLQPLSIQKGLGRLKLPVHGGGNLTPDSVFTQRILTRLMAPFQALPDLYLEALFGYMECFPSRDLVKTTSNRLANLKLKEEDKDLLLCVAHVLCRGYSQKAFKSLLAPQGYQAVFVDEVQDFTEQQVYLMVQQANKKYRAVTVVGDLAQKLHHGNSIDVEACFPGQSVPRVKLSDNLRQTNVPGLSLFSAIFRSVFNGDALPAHKIVLRAKADGDAVVRPKIVKCVDNSEVDAAILSALKKTNDHHTVAVLFPNSKIAERTYKRMMSALREEMIDAEISETVNLSRRHVRHFADVANAKGLEFDDVLLVHTESFDFDAISDINRFYVGITRARRSLTLVHRKSSVHGKLLAVIKKFDALLKN